MLSLPPTVRVFVAVAPLDMRGSFDALAGAVRGMGLDPVLCGGHRYAARILAQQGVLGNS
ncbi:MAG: hypothetical protein IPI67_00095 [Myxococcales bacterium]|nr:hypothetical protein [Myxococcales bacterium]